MTYAIIIFLGLLCGYLIAPRLIAEYDRVIMALHKKVTAAEERIAALETAFKEKLP